MLAALGMLLFGSLLSSCQQIVERAVESMKIVIDPLDVDYPGDRLAVNECIIESATKDLVTGAINRLAKLHKAASTYIERIIGLFLLILKAFFLASKAYLNVISADKTSAESQNLAMTLLSNASLSQDKFSLVMFSLVANAKGNSTRVQPLVPIDAKRVKILPRLLSSIVAEEKSTDLMFTASENASCLHAAHRRFTRLSSCSSFEGCISLLDDVTALDEVSVGHDNLSSTVAREQKVTGTLKTHFILARRFGKGRGSYRTRN